MFVCVCYGVMFALCYCGVCCVDVFGAVCSVWCSVGVVLVLRYVSCVCL